MPASSCSAKVHLQAKPQTKVVLSTFGGVGSLRGLRTANDELQAAGLQKQLFRQNRIRTSFDSFCRFGLYWAGWVELGARTGLGRRGEHWAGLGAGKGCGREASTRLGWVLERAETVEACTGMG